MIVKITAIVVTIISILWILLIILDTPTCVNKSKGPTIGHVIKIYGC